MVAARNGLRCRRNATIVTIPRILHGMGAAHRRNRKEEIRLTRKVVFVITTKSFLKITSLTHIRNVQEGGGADLYYFFRGSTIRRRLCMWFCSCTFLSHGFWGREKREQKKPKGFSKKNNKRVRIVSIEFFIEREPHSQPER
jgi:hypothetical protein